MTSDEINQTAKLLEYEVREKVEAQMWNRLTRFGWLFGLVVTLLGFVGLPTALKYITDSATSDVKKAIESETQELKKRLTVDLATLSIETQRIQQEASRSQELIDELKKYAT